VVICAIFALDLVTAAGWTDWLLYIIPVLIASLFISRGKIIFLACLCSILIITGFFISPSGLEPEIALINRFLGIGVFWIIVVLMLHRKSVLETLELRVQERTADLNKEITEHLRAERALKKSMAELEALNRDLESFSYSISHDLRAPLRYVSGFTDMILKDHGEAFNEEARRKFKVIQDSVISMDQLILGILALSRAGRQELTFKLLDIRDIVQAVVNELLHTADKEHLPEVIISDMLPACGDPVLIRQVFANLISNALKFTRGSERPQIEVGSHNSNGENTYFVRDNGAGFDMKYGERLFGIFKRLHSDSQFEGTGVGLAIVQRIVQRHGGRVWAEGKVNEGATFFFSLPASCNSK
jgi:two-component system, sensor histidine kinase and response regulator